jgi:hypothetical protein
MRRTHSRGDVDFDKELALVVDSTDEAIAAFYKHHGFIALPNWPLTMFLAAGHCSAFLRLVA